ncbi:MAG TPA: hypothetical protein ENF95_01420 [Candidatus Aenigmarchaeota archaeon]|nr:hypothetical protein [Candidatus Aenigmarchaeota archaeon]
MERETEMYLCGEEYSEEYERGEYFFDAVYRVFGLRKLKEIHSGDLSSYLYWIVVGIIAILLMVMLWA